MKSLPDVLALFPPNAGYDYFTRPFGPARRAFDLRTAAWMAEAALLGYADATPATTAFRARQMETGAYGHVEPAVGGQLKRAPYSTQCYVAHDDRVAVVVFRGTELLGPRDAAAWVAKLQGVLRDWLVDAKVKLVDHAGGGHVHGGFDGALNQVWPRVASHLASLPGVPNGSARRSVWFTGHSLGAALATLAADRYARAGGSVAGVYTFGSPSVGDAAFAESYRALDIPTFRIVHDRDLVARVPPLFPALMPGRLVPRYVPVGDPYCLTTGGAALEPREPDRGLSAWAPSLVPHDLTQLAVLSWSQLVAWLLGHTVATGRLVDHAPVYYATHLWNLAEREAA